MRRGDFVSAGAAPFSAASSALGRSSAANEPGLPLPPADSLAAATRASGFGVGLRLLYALSLGAIVALAGLGFSFYSTPLSERPHHPGYVAWRSGGIVGEGLGIAGSSMLVLMLFYSVRKRVRAFRRIGPLSRWLDVHIYFGVVGPLLIVLHSSFKVRGLVALSFWSMIAVVLSGFVGRYLYLQIPRTRAGHELTLVQLERIDGALTRRLRVEFRLPQSALKRLDVLGRPSPARGGLVSGLWSMLANDLRQRRELRNLSRQFRSVPASLLSELERVARERVLTRRRIVFWNQLHSLFHYWHVFHKPFAVVMYLFMVLHIAVVLMAGYGWIWSS